MLETTYADRSDAVADKIRLLQQAHTQQDYEIAMSLCASIKDTLTYERVATGSCLGQPLVGADTFTRTDALPAAWSAGLSAWQFCKVLALTETAGQERAWEPVEVTIACRADHVTDLHRELRVIEIDPPSGSARELPSQVLDVAWVDGQRQARVLFGARVAAHETAHVLLLYGNPTAPLPHYASDLRTEGAGCGLSLSNDHYTAHLAANTGQLQRLDLSARRRSVVDSPRNPMTGGLQLYAGGEGHGEAPHIDWAHDYAPEGFQKFRLTNWAACPNVEIVRGPLCVQVRRWGFPHGPAHPLFTPSRLHVDVRYTFYAGVPWFLKDSRMTVLRDLDGTIRDDEWVFSGQPFTDSLWIDRDGCLREGGVAAGHEEEVWGLGFFHERTRDAFIALFLEHDADPGPPLVHGGATQLDYQGIPRHAQLWSRSPSRQVLAAGSQLRQRNAYLVEAYDGPEAAESLRCRLTQPLQVTGTEPGQLVAPSALALRSQPAGSEALLLSVWAALALVRDDMLYKVDANIVDMGYVYDVRAEGDTILVLLTMPHRGRPQYGYFVGPIRERLLAVEGVRDIVVDFTWEPAWTVARLSAKGRRVMGLDGASG